MVKVKHTHCARMVIPKDDQTTKQRWKPRMCILPKGHKGTHMSSARQFNYFGLHDRCKLW